jgi:sterol desaturase/sphingolipid hydroxylase (fatty acid hydroxylase superfamily)
MMVTKFYRTDYYVRFCAGSHLIFSFCKFTFFETAEAAMAATIAQPGILEPFVRDTPPPIKQPFFLGRLSASLTLQTFNILIFHLYFFQKYSFHVAFWLYMLTAQFMLLLDAVVSNSFGNNVRNLRKAGYSDTITLFFMQANLVSSQLIGYVICCFIVTDPATYTWQCLVDRLAGTDTAPQLLLALATNLVLSDVLFTASHSLLHKVPALLRLHVFHHCSTQSSWNTNLLFHPLDLAMEFAGPAGVLLWMHYYVWEQDQLVLLVTYMVFQVWYAWDHDEHLQFWHVYHHSICGSVYSIYTPFAGNPGKNQLKRYMEEKGLLTRSKKTA